ncbi:MAG: hypothetical protein OHK0029_27290 [Armatimonadaceae bacterium]
MQQTFLPQSVETKPTVLPVLVSAPQSMSQKEATLPTAPQWTAQELRQALSRTDTESDKQLEAWLAQTSTDRAANLLYQATKVRYLSLWEVLSFGGSLVIGILDKFFDNEVLFFIGVGMLLAGLAGIYVLTVLPQCAIQRAGRLLADLGDSRSIPILLAQWQKASFWRSRNHTQIAEALIEALESGKLDVQKETPFPQLYKYLNRRVLPRWRPRFLDLSDTEVDVVLAVLHFVSRHRQRLPQSLARMSATTQNRKLIAETAAYLLSAPENKSSSG